jgi:hypothetical protein
MWGRLEKEEMKDLFGPCSKIPEFQYYVFISETPYEDGPFNLNIPNEMRISMGNRKIPVFWL